MNSGSLSLGEYGTMRLTHIEGTPSVWQVTETAKRFIPFFNAGLVDEDAGEGFVEDNHSEESPSSETDLLSQDKDEAVEGLAAVEESSHRGKKHFVHGVNE